MASVLAHGGDVRHPHGQRRRRRPARHRHARRGPHEPEPLPRGRDRVPVRAPRRLAPGCRDRQDPRLELDDRPGRRLARPPPLEVPVGFKWFVPGLVDGSVGFGGEESAGASFLRIDGTVWTTDKDGILLCLLASEILAVTGKIAVAAVRRARRALRRPRLPARGCRGDPRAEGARSASSTATRSRRPSSPASRSRRKLSHAPGNGAAIGGVKVVDRARVVRGAAERHRGRLQDLRRVVPRAGAPRGRAGGGEARRERRARVGRLRSGATPRRRFARSPA